MTNVSRWLIYDLRIYPRASFQDINPNNDYFLFREASSLHSIPKDWLCIGRRRIRKRALLKAVIGVERPLAPAGGGLGIQPVGRQHHEDEVGVELLLLFSHTAQLVIVRLHACRREPVSSGNVTKNSKSSAVALGADFSGTAASV